MVVKFEFTEIALLPYPQLSSPHSLSEMGQKDNWPQSSGHYRSPGSTPTCGPLNKHFTFLHLVSDCNMRIVVVFYLMSHNIVRIKGENVGERVL